MANRTVAARPSAPLVLGVLSGTLAAIIVLPTAIPLTYQVAEIEVAAALRHVQTAASYGAQVVEKEGALPPGTQKRLNVDHIHVRVADGSVAFAEGVDLPEQDTLAACSRPEQVARFTGPDGDEWVASCEHFDDGQVVAAWRPDYVTTNVGYLILALAAIVGIITALGVLRLLSPLSGVAAALGRVERGERGVQVEKTGLAELDELVVRLNAAARAMEQREDAITARIQVVQEMARMVAHEVRNPLQSLELLTSLIAIEGDPVERREIAQSIRKEIQALDLVVNRMLREGASKGALKMNRAPQRLAPLLQQAVALRQPEASSRGIRLYLGPVSERILPIDAALVGRSIENLVLNAIQAVPENGGRVKASITEEYPYLCIEVEDNGPGVDPEFGVNIFDANVTSKEGGTGLGLALVKGVVEAHGGYIEYQRSMDLGGAHFIARLPIEGTAPGAPVRMSPPS